MTRPSWALMIALATAVACSQAPQPTAAAPPGPPTAATGADAGAAAREPRMTRDAICAAALLARTTALDGRAPFSAPEPSCSAEDPFCNFVARTPDAARTCFVANDNLARAERDSRARTPAMPTTHAAWDAQKPPRYLDRIDAHLHLTAVEHEMLRRNRFVVLDRLAYPDYASAFHDVFQEQLPLFVGLDPILHAVFRGTELALARIERKRLLPALTRLLTKLRSGLRTAGLDVETRADIDVVLGVAWALAQPDPSVPASAFREGDNEAAIAELVRQATSPQPELARATMFGRERMIDFTQLTPRGHYATSLPDESALDGYFRSVMWLSRLELNLVSRGAPSSSPDAEPRQTPREARDALALAELVERTGAIAELRAFEEVYTAFAGRREDAPVWELSRLAAARGIRASDPDAGARLAAAIGDRFSRTARTHFMMEGAGDLPAITTLLGPRIPPDIAPLTQLVHGTVDGRFELGAGDVGFVLGHDRARAFIPDFPRIASAAPAARAQLKRTAAASAGLYGSWLRAILELGAPPEGVVPSFVRGDAYADHRLNSALVGYAQLRHTFVLLAAQGYDQYGCEIPDAYVEPRPNVLEALLAHVRGLRGQAAGWAGLERVLAMLAAIARDETSGRPLAEAQRRWLAMVSENIPVGGYAGDSGAPPKWTGWYFDMFDDRQHGAAKSTALVADYMTLTTANEVAYLGAEGPRLGVFIVDANGEPRAMVGPVAKGFEAHVGLGKRLDDETIVDPAIEKRDPWRASYAAKGAADPAIGLEGEIVGCTTARGTEWRVAMRAARPVGRTTVTLLDHHGDDLTRGLVIDVGRTWTVGAFDLPAAFQGAPRGVEAFHVRVEDLARSGAGRGPFDLASSPGVFTSIGVDPDPGPSRRHGIGSFSIGMPAPAEPRAPGAPGAPPYPAPRPEPAP